MLKFPLVITGDWHIHGRGNRRRLEELAVLQKYFSDISLGYGTLVVCGDILDRNAPLNITTILLLADIFKHFTNVYIVLGNHDTPTRSVKTTQLDLFTLLPNVTVVKEPLCMDSKYLFLPYYADVPAMSPTVELVFAHRDIFELNGYADQDFAIPLKYFDSPVMRYVFNGHLHNCGVQQLPSGHGYYIQLGAPWPCTWADVANKNNFVWIMTQEQETPQYLATNITGDAGTHGMAFTRSRDITEETEYSTAEVINALDDIRDNALSIPDALAAVGTPKVISQIVVSVLNKVSNSVEKETI